MEFLRETRTGIHGEWRLDVRQWVLGSCCTQGHDKNIPCASIKQDRQCACKCNIEARSRNCYCSGKAINITYCDCVSVSLVTRHAKRIRHIILPSVACLVVPCFFLHYLINGTILDKKLVTIKCVFWFSLQLFSELFLILRRIKRDMIKNYAGLHLK